MLTSSGYRKNHYTHFARLEDGDLYYRHAFRGEDLLALGPTADGIFGAYQYRHPELEGYLAGGETSRPALEGGLRETVAEQRLRPLTSSLLAAEINGRLLDWAGSAGLLELWQDAGLIRYNSRMSTWTLAANGSVFISGMLEQIKMAAGSARES
jgi:hypothetical protein